MVEQTLSEKVDGLERQLKANTALTIQVAADTSELIDFFKSAKAALKFLVIFGKVLKWCAAVITSVGVIWAAIKLSGK